MTEQADFFPRRSREGEEMSIAVPIILAVAFVVSLSGQVGRFWPNYQSEQDEKSDKQDESKDKSDKGDQKPSEKNKSGQGSSSKSKPGKSPGIQRL
jgi:Ca2+/H+ antiporter